MMTSTLAQLHSSDIVPVVAISIGGGIALIAIVFGTISKIARKEQIERSRREIAAYVAEGSMTPAEGERLLNAGAHGSERC